MGNGPSTRSDVADDAFSDDAKAHAATKLQAVARGRLVRKDSLSQKLQGAVMIRTNLPKSWRASDGVPRGLEIEHRRCLAFVGPHLVVFRTRALGLSRERGAADFLIDPSQIDTVYRDALHPAVFAVGMRDEQLDRLFRAPDRAACERTTPEELRLG